MSWRYVWSLHRIWSRPGGIKYHFLSLWYDLGLNPGLPDHWQALCLVGQWLNRLYKLLLICATKVPFYDHNGEIYTQINGVFMSSVLGLTFSNFYMSNLENKIFNDTEKLHIYGCYVDNILILAEIEEIKKITRNIPK